MQRNAVTPNVHMSMHGVNYEHFLFPKAAAAAAAAAARQYVADIQKSFTMLSCMSELIKIQHRDVNTARIVQQED